MLKKKKSKLNILVFYPLNKEKWVIFNKYLVWKYLDKELKIKKIINNFLWLKLIYSWQSFRSQFRLNWKIFKFRFSKKSNFDSSSYLFLYLNLKKVLKLNIINLNKEKLNTFTKLLIEFKLLKWIVKKKNKKILNRYNFFIKKLYLFKILNNFFLNSTKKVPNFFFKYKFLYLNNFKRKELNFMIKFSGTNLFFSLIDSQSNNVIFHCSGGHAFRMIEKKDNVKRIIKKKKKNKITLQKIKNLKKKKIVKDFKKRSFFSLNFLLEEAFFKILKNNYKFFKISFYSKPTDSVLRNVKTFWYQNYRWKFFLTEILILPSICHNGLRGKKIRRI